MTDKYVSPNGFTIDTPEEFWADVRDNRPAPGDPFWRSREYVEDSFESFGSDFLGIFSGYLAPPGAEIPKSEDFVQMVYDSWQELRWGGDNTDMISLDDARRLLLVQEGE